MTDFSHCGNGLLTILWLGAIIAIAVCGYLLYSIVSFRKSQDSSTATYVHRATVEVVWAMIPIAILIITAMPSVKTLLTMDNSCAVVVGAAD